MKAERAHIVKKKGDVVTFFYSHHANEAKDIYTALTEIPALHIDPTMKTIRFGKSSSPPGLGGWHPKGECIRKPFACISQQDGSIQPCSIGINRAGLHGCRKHHHQKETGREYLSEHRLAVSPN